VNDRQGGRSVFPPLARYERSFFKSGLNSLREVALSSSCFAKRELASVNFATTFRSTALAVAKLANAPSFCLAKSSSLA
jgi:hypothetical protein